VADAFASPDLTAALDACSKAVRRWRDEPTPDVQAGPAAWQASIIERARATAGRFMWDVRRSPRTRFVVVRGVVTTAALASVIVVTEWLIFSKVL
jgi:hypothetical protein